MLKGKVVIVTGASRGIGRAVAKVCAREGAKIVLNYFGKEDVDFGGESAVAQAVNEVKSVGGEVVAVEGDVSDPATGQKLVDVAVEKFGGVDVLVANAGVSIFHPFIDVSKELFKTTVDVNLGGTFFFTGSVAKQLIKQGRGGSIVALSSVCALMGGKEGAHYHATKSAIHSVMQSVAIALGEHNIRCTKIGKAEEVAECVAFLASDRASYVTGAAWLVDGGIFVNLH